MINGVNNTDSSSSSQDTTNKSTTDATTSLANQQTFLKLLVAQIQNQDPMNPTDAVQYVSQLSQFAGVEQLIQIRQDVEKLTGSTDSTAAQQTTN